MNPIFIETYVEIKKMIQLRISQQQELDENECIIISEWFAICEDGLYFNNKYEKDLLSRLRESSIIIPDEWILHFIPTQTEAYYRVIQPSHVNICK